MKSPKLLLRSTKMVDKKTIEGLDDADTNGDGHISAEELEMHLEFKRKELEDADAQRDAMRKMTWFALFGMLLYPAIILITTILGQDKAAQLISDIAPTYFVSISVLVAAFFGADAVKGKKPPPPRK
jgi:hypothetical protein